MTVPGSDEQQELQRRLEDALATVEDLRSRLERSDDRLAAFAAQVTHDLKTPLTTMSLSLELIRDEMEDGASAEDVVPLITRALSGSARMATMIEDVLTFARLGTQIERRPVDLAAVATQVRSDLAAGLDGGLDGVELVIDDLPVVRGDEAQLRSLIRSLVSNAAKFRSPERSPVVRVGSTLVGSRWRIEVADNGTGIPEDERERVFEPMVRLDKRIDGVGVGLATCRRIADSHDGTIGVVANPAGEGSVFWFELPA